jgi:hypothetical protein
MYAEKLVRFDTRNEQLVSYTLREGSKSIGLRPAFSWLLDVVRQVRGGLADAGKKEEANAYNLIATEQWAAAIETAKGLMSIRNGFDGPAQYGACQRL